MVNEEKCIYWTRNLTK